MYMSRIQHGVRMLQKKPWHFPP